MNKKKVIFLSGGGTGGHLFLAIALREQLEDSSNLEIYIFTDQRCKRYITKNDKNIFVINSKLSFTNLSHIFGSIWVNLISIAKILFISIKKRPNLLVAFGGYVTIPNIIVAIICRTKIVLYEANAVLGKANRFFAKFAQNICTAYYHVLKLDPKYQHKTYVVYPLIRKNRIITTNNIKNRDLYHQKSDKFKILILGGSQGAKIFSTLITDAIILLQQYREDIEILQQAKKEDVHNISLLYQRIGIKHQVKDFFHNISEMFCQADLAISRSGASTIAELVANNIPTIFIPLPNSKDNHQYYNVEELVSNKASWYFSEKAISSQDIADKILRLKLNVQDLKTAKVNLKKYYYNKRQKISNIVLQLLN